MGFFFVHASNYGQSINKICFKIYCFPLALSSKEISEFVLKKKIKRINTVMSYLTMDRTISNNHTVDTKNNETFLHRANKSEVQINRINDLIFRFSSM